MGARAVEHFAVLWPHPRTESSARDRNFHSDDNLGIAAATLFHCREK